MKNRQRLTFSFLVFFLLLVLSACAHSDGPYKGKVVDIKTGKPIEGAVVAALWTIESVPHAQRTCDAEETITDKNGEFILPKGSCVSHPLAKIFKPDVVVFKPGYLGYPPLGYTQEERKAYMPNFTGDEFTDKNQYNIIELGKPKTREERELTQSHAQSPLTDGTISKLPILIKLVNEEGKNLGLDEVYKKGATNEK